MWPKNMWKRIPAALDAEERVQNQQRRTFTIIHTSCCNKNLTIN